MKEGRPLQVVCIIMVQRAKYVPGCRAGEADVSSGINLVER